MIFMVNIPHDPNFMNFDGVLMQDKHYELCPDNLLFESCFMHA